MDKKSANFQLENRNKVNLSKSVLVAKLWQAAIDNFSASNAVLISAL